MLIHLNGAEHDLPEDTTIAALLERMQLTGRRVAVEVNLEIVPRSLHATACLAEGDRVEVVHAIGGG
jgi:sulfur carrier protein